MDRKRIPAGLSPATFVEQAEAWAKELEDRAARRRGLSLDIARAEVARKAGVPSGLLRSLRKRRIKDIGAAAYVSIRRALINELIEEVLRAQHELSVAEATGADPFGDEMASLDEDIDRLHALLKREVEP